MSDRVRVQALTAYELFYNYWRVQYFSDGRFEEKQRKMLQLLSEEIVKRNLMEMRFHASTPVKHLEEGDGLRILLKIRDKLEKVVVDSTFVSNQEALYMLSDLNVGIERLRAGRKAGP